jgi:hypothetical protein
MKIKNLVTKKKKILPLTRKKKNQIALDYIKQIKDNYDKESKDQNTHVGSKIGANMNSLYLMVIEAKLLTGQLDATDDLLVALEELIIRQV